MSKHKVKNKHFLGIKPILGLMALVFLFVSFIFVILPNKTQAACSPSTSYGTDTLAFSTPASVNSTETYVLWTRMSIPSSSSDSVMASVDGGNCYTIGGNSSIPTNTLTWVNYANGQTATPITLSLAPGAHSIEFYGTNAGVSIDKVLLVTNTSCTPSGNGTNCQPLPTLTGTISVSSYYGAVGGTVPVNISVSNISGTLNKATLYYDYTPIATLSPSSSGNSFSYNWNTTTIQNAKVGLWALVSDSAGQSVSTNVLNLTIVNPFSAKIVAPATSTAVKGTTPVQVDVYNAVDGVTKIQFFYSYIKFIADIETTTTPYTYSWNTTTIPDSYQSIYAAVTDGAGKTVVTPVVGVAIDN